MSVPPVPAVSAETLDDGPVVPLLKTNCEPFQVQVESVKPPVAIARIAVWITLATPLSVVCPAKVPQEMLVATLPSIATLKVPLVITVQFDMACWAGVSAPPIMRPAVAVLAQRPM